MIYSKEEHINFLNQELKAQTEAFRQKLDTSAIFLLKEREELFVAQFQGVSNGEMILKFSNKRGLPRQGEYLYCFIVPKELRDYNNWDNRTYGDLIKSKTNYTECVCIWQAPSDYQDYSIAGFRGVELEFAEQMQDSEEIILILGQNKPPFEYIINLQKIIESENTSLTDKILSQDFQQSIWRPTLIDSKKNIAEFLLDQLSLQETIILQGPPGTGKSHLIAEICEILCQQKKSILITALTNRALIEIVKKPAVKNLLNEHRILKTKLSVDEARTFPDLQLTKDLTPQPGNIILSTFYITSGHASDVNNEPPFDYVIIDEASQALLAMFAGACLLGKKNIWIGDINQLPPVVALSFDKVNRKNYGSLVDGLKALSDNALIPNFQLTETHRLTERASRYTGIFYNNTLKSISTPNLQLNFQELFEETNKFLNTNGGSTLIKTDLPVGSLRPIGGISIITSLLRQLLSINEELHISVLTYFIETTKALQKQVFQAIGYRKNLLIETVSRIQGLTTDICIYLVPNASYHRSLERRLFNVATSRAKRHTLIIVDKGILNRSQIDNEVKQYLHQLDLEFSFYIKSESEPKLLR